MMLGCGEESTGLEVVWGKEFVLKKGRKSRSSGKGMLEKKGRVPTDKEDCCYALGLVVKRTLIFYKGKIVSMFPHPFLFLRKKNDGSLDRGNGIYVPRSVFCF